MPNLETVTLPANLTSIPKDAFLNSAKLVTVNFGDASTNNGSGSGPSGRAVTGDANAITLPSKIATIGQNAFQGTAATTVDLSKVTGLTEISNSVFQNMTKLETVTLPSGLTTIRDNAFQGDTKLVTLSTKEAPASSGGNAQARADEATTANTATFGKSLTNIGQNAFQGTGFTIVDLSKAGTATSGSTGNPSTPTPSLTVNSGAFTNMADLTTVKLPANANINPANFGNPADATEQKLTSITYVRADSTTPATAATATTGNDANISSTNFSKIKNQSIEIKSSVGGSTINFNGGVFNGNETMTTLKLSLATGTRNGNNPL